MTTRDHADPFARLLTGEVVNGELKALPEPLRTMADFLSRVTVDEALTGQARREALASARASLWEAMMAARPDRDELVAAVAGVDPEGPTPRGEADEPHHGWPPLRLPTSHPAEPFPIAVFPEAAARLVTEGADAIGCPRDFLGVPALVVAAGSIGRSVALAMKPGYFAPASLYAGCVGPPSDGKTPGLKTAAEAVRRIDRALAERYATDRQRWEDEARRNGPDGKKPDPGPPPRPRRIDVDDITLETIPGILADNPRGLIMVRDELAALLLGMNQYKSGGKGSDRPTLLKIWSGDTIVRDRVANPDGVPVRCPAPCLSIVGGLTPDMIGALADPRGRTDGFIDRFLFAYPDPLPVTSWSDHGVPVDVSDGWSELVARLWRRPMNVKEGRPVPHAAAFTAGGKAEWRERYDAHSSEMNSADFPPALRGPWGKLREYAGRLALILACLDHAADPTADPEAVPAVGTRAVADAWRLVAYFKSHARRVHTAVALGSGVGDGPVVRAVLGWIRAGRRPSFTERDIKQARRWITDDDLTAAMAYLTQRHAIRARESADESPRVGRPRSPVYDVNPALLDTQNARITQNPVGYAGGDHNSESFENFEN